MNGAGPAGEPARSSEFPGPYRRWVSDLLLGGVLASALLLIVGLLLLAPGLGGADVGPVRLPALSLGNALLHADPYAVLWLGLLILVLTPFVRVVLSIALFFAQRDWPFVGLTAVVLATLVVSVAAGVSL